ncbi:hypothetical protein H0H93_010220 [Arthromyces matolae]|nr:hypothetical protein H0H93_010220 [Arthromyces matolae]
MSIMIYPSVQEPPLPRPFTVDPGISRITKKQSNTSQPLNTAPSHPLAFWFDLDWRRHTIDLTRRWLYLENRSGHDESVEVNQRALIDKVLARYSGEFTVFRELLQNSDDAQATAVEIHFDTQSFINNSERPPDNNANVLPDLKTAIVHRWTFKNNGIVFRDEDWNRLKKIAEGNPDEEKIGAFGVGFYSLFSVTEEPFVTSGEQWMGFHWKDKKDQSDLGFPERDMQLFARRGELPNNGDQVSPWTTFEMVLRDPGPIPVAFDFSRFLTSSITFMLYLSEVSVFFDEKCLARLKKTRGIPKQLGLPKAIHPATSSGIMTIKDVKCTPLHIQAEVMQWVYTSGSEKKRPMSVFKSKTNAGSFFSSLFAFAANSAPQRQSTPLPSAKDIDPSTVNETSVSLSIFSAEVDVTLGKKIAGELYRSTKKNPPTKLKYELIYTAKDEYDASKKEEELYPATTGSIFQGLRADLEGSGATRLFIGHATGQTTGIGGHMAARFIPTVERESIDLMDRNVAVWNRELLFIGGILARTAYEMEMESIKNHWEGSIALGLPATSVDQQVEFWLRNRALHALKFFTFHPSTPSAEVSQYLEKAFFDCSTTSFALISNAGVKNAADVRLPDPVFTTFLKQLPVLPEDILAGASSTVAILQNRGLIKGISFEDVLKELRSRPLSEDEMIACLRWWIGVNKEASKFQLAPRTQFLNAAILASGTSEDNQRVVTLSSIRTFVNTRSLSSIIPLDGPLPDHLLPTEIAKHFTVDDLAASFPWTELTIPDWIGHISSPQVRKDNADYDICLTPPWAERVLTIVAKAWPSLSGPAKGEIYTHLRALPCIPTNVGTRVPDQSYFAQANIFNDLPVVTLPSGTPIRSPLERVLVVLGVRKHVDLQVVFNRMIKTNEWTVADLAKYLVSVQSTLNAEEWARLKLTAAFLKEGSKSESDQKMRYQAQQLYEPMDIFRSLGLPILGWGQGMKWRSSSDEAKFLFELGLLRYPPLPVLINLCASVDSTLITTHTHQVRTVALKYLLDHIGTHYKDYDPSNFATVAFIPAIKDSTPSTGTIKEVFADPDWAIMGFQITSPALSPDAALKLKVRQHPPSVMILDLLEKTPPKDQSEAKAWFSLLGSRVSDFSSQDIQRLSHLKFVPVMSDEGTFRWLEPSRCYFGGDAQGTFHSKLFVFINLGLLANNFLSVCGSKHEPSVEEVVQILLEDPHKFYRTAESPSQFLTELRNIAFNHKLIKAGTITRMKKAAVLLGVKRKPHTGGDNGDLDDLDEEDWETQYDLLKAEEIIIADDAQALRAFGDSFFTAPQEDMLEAFYSQLGSRRLSSLVKEEYQPSAEIKHSKISAETRALILERLPLFLHEHSHARTLVSYTWLTSQVNFVVKTYGKLSVTKSLTFGNLRLTRQQDASAVALRKANTGPIQLWLADNAQIDLYDNRVKNHVSRVATSLNNQIFTSPKANDALLFMTILSTDLKALKRRGYNGAPDEAHIYSSVDRILRQQRAERQAAEKAKMENVALLSQSPVVLDPPSSLTVSPPTPVSSPNAAPPVPLISKPPPGKLVLEAPKTPSSAVEPPLTPSINPLTLFRRKTVLGPSELSPRIPPVSQKSPLTPNTDSFVTPLKSISSNIDMAIRACRPESGNLLRNRQEMRLVRESLDEGYCDISARTGDLNLIALLKMIEHYHQGRWETSKFTQPKVRLVTFDDVPDLQDFLESQHDPIARFFTLAHEIAHNLVHPHNSEHEFYFSAICEKHIENLGGLFMSTSIIHEKFVSRRKPRITYKSPSGDPSFLITMGSCSTPLRSKGPLSRSPTQPPNVRVPTNSIQITYSKLDSRRKIPVSPLLPLYHPLGWLASSLPPLDPTNVGLPMLPDDLIARRIFHDVAIEDEALPLNSRVVSSSLLDIEVREKSTSRKKRTSGGSKRKRRDVEDADGTYPSKRTRTPRGVSNLANGDEEPPIDSATLDTNPPPELMLPILEVLQMERRPTRSQGPPKHDFSTADRPTLASPKSTRSTPELMIFATNSTFAPRSSKHRNFRNSENFEKEEGELSDDVACFRVPS